MKSILASYFFYTRSERRGVLILLAVCICFLTLPRFYQNFVRRSASTDFTEFQTHIAAFASFRATDTEGGNFDRTDDLKPNRQKTLFAFDPNGVTYDELLILGMAPRVAKAWTNYTAKGGKFRRAEDVKKVYGITEQDFDRLEAYISLENDSETQFSDSKRPPQYKSPNGQTTQRPIVLQDFDPNTASEEVLLGLGLEKNLVNNLLKYRQHGGQFRKKEDLKKLYGFSDIDFLLIEKHVQIVENQKLAQHPVFDQSKNGATQNTDKRDSHPIDINRSSLDDWLQLRGIGHTFAARIVTYRESLGGFATHEQVKEVHGIPDSTWQMIRPYLKNATPIYRKLQINKSEIDALRHPYLSRKQAEVIARYRLNHGDFKSMDDLKKTGILPDVTLVRLQPYIEF